MSQVGMASQEWVWMIIDFLYWKYFGSLSISQEKVRQMILRANLSVSVPVGKILKRVFLYTVSFLSGFNLYRPNRETGVPHYLKWMQNAPLVPWHFTSPPLIPFPFPVLSSACKEGILSRLTGNASSSNWENSILLTWNFFRPVTVPSGFSDSPAWAAALWQ